MEGTLRWILDNKWAIVGSALEAIIDVVKRSDITSEEVARAIHGTKWQNYIDSDGHSINPSLLQTSSRPILDGSHSVTYEDSVAILPVVGPIFPRANLFTSFSGGTSLELLAKDFNVALNDDNIETIILNVDSPGGDVTGVSEFSDMLFNAREKKNIISYVYGMGASAALWIASASSKVILGNTAEMGSLGVVAGYVSTKDSDEKKGIKHIEIVSSQSPNKRPDVTTNEGRAQIQKLVDDVADVFVATVARNRGISSEEVLSKFGQGKMFVGQESVDRGLADGLGSLEGLINEHKQINSNKSLYNNGGFMDLSELKSKHPEVYKEAKAEGVAEANIEVESKLAEARKEGAEAECKRIKDIESIEAPGAEDVIAENKFKQSTTKESIATLILAKQADDRRKALTTLKEDGSKLNASIEDVGNSEATEDPDEAERKSLVALASEAGNLNRR